MLRIVTLLGALALLSSCKDEPILSGAGMYSDKNSPVLFTEESVFTVTSKKSGGGVTTRSGYTTCYLNAIDMTTGEVIKRKKIGDYKERVVFLGTAGGKAWFFSNDKDISLHTRDPRTLDITLTVKDIIAKNSALSAGLAEQSYQVQLDTSGKFLFITTKDGYNYLVHPQTLIAEKTGERSSRRFYGGTDALRHISNLAINDSLQLSFSGNTRAVLKVEQKAFDQKSYDFYSKNGHTPPSATFYYRTRATEVKEEISFIEPKGIADRSAPAGEAHRDPLLVHDNTIFVLSKSMLGNEFNWIISAIKAEYGNVRQTWQYTIGGTEKVNYSDKDLLYAGTEGNRLILVFENMIAALELSTGKLLWRKDIRK